MKFRCEVAVSLILPAIKSAIAKNLKANKIPQKDIARKLYVTEAAVSQYLSGKRATGFTIPEYVSPMVAAVASAVNKGEDKELLEYGISQICKEILKRDFKDLPKHALCYEDEAEQVQENKAKENSDDEEYPEFKADNFYY